MTYFGLTIELISNMKIVYKQVVLNWLNVVEEIDKIINMLRPKRCFVDRQKLFAKRLGDWLFKISKCYFMLNY